MKQTKHNVQVQTRITKTRVGGVWIVWGGEGDLQGHLNFHRHQVLRALGAGRYGTPTEARMMKEEGFDVVEVD